ncbi:hypothetical protein AA102526_0634 [Asaia lannensis NBRC 102526]|nr:hypothetical protein AA102526_0634 [Asaia lannensis NBRC 102526]
MDRGRQDRALIAQAGLLAVTIVSAGLADTGGADRSDGNRISPAGIGVTVAKSVV